MTYLLSDIDHIFLMYLLPFFRIGALFLTMPVIGTRVVPARTRIILAFAITVVVAPLIPPVATHEMLSLATFGDIAAELLIGGTMGFVFQVAFQCFVVSGQIIAVTIGLGFASMNDPINGVQTTVVSQFYLVAATLLFIVFDGHLVLIQMVIDSFITIPLGEFGHVDFYALANLGSWLFSTSLLMTISIMTALLLVNIAFGVMSRAAPQLNIFSVGFPFTLTLGMILIYMGLNGMLEFFDRIVSECLMLIKSTIA
ncbi:MAG: flagellar biosynthetic protein FliR [Marinagarivorans sp.]|nr:flagellar biosynthetic protein FliR [Marinagarivorans sp.]